LGKALQMSEQTKLETTYVSSRPAVSKMRRTIHLSHMVIVRAPGLLPMWYTPAELEQELGVSARTVRAWQRFGLPYRRDERGHLWIDGRQFAAWVKEVCQPRPGRRLNHDEAYCLHCRGPVKLINPTRQRHGNQVTLKGQCPQCGQAIFRGGRHGESAELSLGQSVS
jgi:hypothetical protein